MPSASLVPSRPTTPRVLLTTAGMQPFKPYFLGRETPPAPRLTDVPELLPHHRHRGGRQHRPPPDLLRDARQLELRRLLQGRVDPLGLGALDRGLRHRPGEDLGHGLRRRRGARPRPRRRGDRDLAARPASPRSGSSGSAARTTSGRPARPAPAAPARSSTSTAAPTSAPTTTAPATTASASSSSGTTSS